MKQSRKSKAFETKTRHLGSQGSAPRKKRNYKNFFILTLIIILAAIPFVMGKFYEFNSPDPFDSAANIYSAQHILSGSKIGIDEEPSAALGTLLVNILGAKLFGFSEFGPKLIQAFFQAAALILMLVAMRKLFGTLAAAVGVITCSIYLSFPYIAKFGNVKEQYIIACMIMGISCFILYQFSGKRFLAILTGSFLIWAPLFKETGLSALGALGLFLIAQPVLKNSTWKQTFTDIAFIACGAAAAIAPVYLWIICWNVKMGLPYAFVWKTVAAAITPVKTSAAGAGSYVSQARKIMPFSEVWPRVLRFCLTLILPVSLATGSVVARLKCLISKNIADKPVEPKQSDRFVLLLTLWWMLDMAFVWVSPRSYEQYYLPLTASGAFLGGYLISLYSDAFAAAKSKSKWLLIGAAGFACMAAMTWHVFFGLKTSAYSGLDYEEKRHGYAQAFRQASNRRTRRLQGYWEQVGDYIREHSTPADKIYVWGWYPGIYVQAQRFSPSSKAFESEMHIRTPQSLAENIRKILTAFEKEKPKFIVDSRKRHLPLDRPPFELWPIMPEGFMGVKESAFLPANKNVIILYEKWWADYLRKHFGEEEALRFEAMKPLRDFVMANYRIVETFGEHVLFELADSPENKEPQ